MILFVYFYHTACYSIVMDLNRKDGQSSCIIIIVVYSPIWAQAGMGNALMGPYGAKPMLGAYQAGLRIFVWSMFYSHSSLWLCATVKLSASVSYFNIRFGFVSVLGASTP